MECTLLTNEIGLQYTMESFDMDNLEIVYGLFKEVRYPLFMAFDAVEFLIVRCRQLYISL